jgi:hypothetical protein
MYKKMIMQAKAEGKASEDSMWKEIEHVDGLLEELKAEHPDLYWKYLRKAHMHLYGPHYAPEFAEYDISQMHSTDKNGVKHIGAHWTRQQVVTEWQGKVFPPGTTDCDKWVAANAFWHDLHREFEDGDILKAAYLFFFADEDSKSKGKVWDYINC